MDYRAHSEEELGWVVTTRDAAENMTFSYARNFRYRLARLRNRLIRWLTPEPLEPTTTPPGFWRQRRQPEQEIRTRLFDTILPLRRGMKAVGMPSKPPCSLPVTNRLPSTACILREGAQRDELGNVTFRLAGS
jgi:hypothetical protein